MTILAFLRPAKYDCDLLREAAAQTLRYAAREFKRNTSIGDSFGRHAIDRALELIREANRIGTGAAVVPFREADDD